MMLSSHTLNLCYLYYQVLFNIFNLKAEYDLNIKLHNNPNWT